MSAARRQMFIEAARDWLGTPFHYSASVYGQGVDCVQLLIAAGMGAGLLNKHPPELVNYPPLVHRKRMAAIISNYLIEVKKPDIQPGDILWLLTRRLAPLHFAIVTETGIIHANAEAKKVVETRLPREYQARISSAWKFKALENE